MSKKQVEELRSSGPLFQDMAVPDAMAHLEAEGHVNRERARKNEARRQQYQERKVGDVLHAAQQGQKGRTSMVP